MVSMIVGVVYMLWFGNIALIRSKCREYHTYLMDVGEASLLVVGQSDSKIVVERPISC